MIDHTLRLVRLLVPISVLLTGLPARAGSDWLQDLRQRTHLSATLESQYAISFSRARTQKWEFVAEPELEMELPGDLDLTVNGRIRADAWDRIEPDSPRYTEVSEISRKGWITGNLSVELREAHLQGALGRALFTLGKQQIVWGKADGLKVLDVVNPQSFREFILEDFDTSRIPLWSLNVEYPVGDVTLQFIWTPDPSFHEIPRRGALYEFTSPLLVPVAPPGVATRVDDVDRPSSYFFDSDVGGRLSAFWKGWDLTLNYLWRYDDRPVFRTSVALGPMGPVATVSPGYERTHLVGGTFSNAFGDLTLRGEVGWSSRLFFLTSDPTDTDGVSDSSELAYVIGLDWFGFRDALLSFQLFQSAVFEDIPGLVRDRVETTGTFLARRDFLNDTLSAEVIWLHSISQGDGLVRPKVSYELNDHVKMWLGCDVFYGRSSGVFGQYGGNSRALIGLQWGI